MNLIKNIVGTLILFALTYEFFILLTDQIIAGNL